MEHVTEIMNIGDLPLLRFAFYLSMLTERERQQFLAAIPENPSPEWVRDFLAAKAAEAKAVLARK